jgi:hypothetical protein
MGPRARDASEPRTDSYSLAASFLFPGWLRRFQSPNYRQFAEEIVGDNCPPHISIRCWWLSKEEMGEFKELYYDWRAVKAEACTGQWGVDGLPTHIRDRVDDLAGDLERFMENQRQSAEETPS